VEDDYAITTSLDPPLKIYGTPVQPPFCDWAFNRGEEQIQKYWDNIPKGLDILLLHCPPYGILDSTHHPKYTSEHIGSKSLLKRIKEVKPKLVVFGHNHGEHGVVEEDGIKYVNASLVDELYKMTRKPIIIEMEL
jgi:Icc-related predicted phosphoesterase